MARLESLLDKPELDSRKKYIVEIKIIPKFRSPELRERIYSAVRMRNFFIPILSEHYIREIFGLVDGRYEGLLSMYREIRSGVDGRVFLEKLEGYIKSLVDFLKNEDVDFEVKQKLLREYSPIDLPQEITLDKINEYVSSLIHLKEFLQSARYGRNLSGELRGASVGVYFIGEDGNLYVGSRIRDIREFIRDFPEHGIISIGVEIGGGVFSSSF